LEDHLTRFASLLLFGFCLVASLPISPDAATLQPAGVEAGSANIIDTAGPRCGRYAH